MGTRGKTVVLVSRLPVLLSPTAPQNYPTLCTAIQAGALCQGAADISVTLLSVDSELDICAYIFPCISTATFILLVFPNEEMEAYAPSDTVGKRQNWNKSLGLIFLGYHVCSLLEFLLPDNYFCEHNPGSLDDARYNLGKQWILGLVLTALCDLVLF